MDHFDLLIIDDDPDLLGLLADTFAEESLLFTTATSLTEARRKLSQYAFRVVLSDHNLPDGNGVDFLAELRGNDVKTIPILMTGLLDQQVAVEAINRGMVFRFVTKPLDLKALIQAVFRALEHYEADREHERLTRDVIQRNQELLKHAEEREHRLHLAARRIRSEREVVKRQKSHIDELYAEIQTAYLHTVTSLTAAIEAKDHYTKGHSERVYYYCSLIADVLDLPEQNRTHLRFASVLHDLGKIGIPDSILLKPGRLTAEEAQVMASHLKLTDDILKPLPFLESVRTIIRSHHERFDGLGYPQGLKGEGNCLEGRILAVADAYDAMRSNRAYRRARSREEATAELRAGAGTQFCPMCVGALLNGLDRCGEAESQGLLDTQTVVHEEELPRLLPASDSIRINAILN